MFNSIYFGKGESVISERTSELAAYYAAISVFKPLTTDEEVELAYKIKQGDKAAKDKLVNANLRAVVSIVKRHYANYGGCLTMMDLISAGNIGLMKAADKFDPTIGVKFLSYAVNDIRNAIIQEIKKSSRIVANYHTDAPTDHTSLDEQLSDDDSTTLGDVMCTTTDAEGCLSESLTLDVLRIINSLLNPTELKVICVLYGIGTPAKSIWEVAEDYNKSEERIRQISVKAICKIRANKNAMKLLENYI
jgi:RNA polymerase primary sigma factor